MFMQSACDEQLFRVARADTLEFEGGWSIPGAPVPMIISVRFSCDVLECCRERVTK